jgi:uncharacterized membrane protein YfcA
MFEGRWIYVWLALAAAAAGAVNSIAGGGTLLTFPSLLAALSSLSNGAVIANATSTVALVPGSLAAAWGYRKELQRAWRWVPLLTAPSLAGGLLGSLLVTELNPKYFDALVPWLILTASVLFLLQPFLARSVTVGAKPPLRRTVAGVVAFQFLVGVYGGYFGAGIGILMLSSLALMGLTDIHVMNGLKNYLAGCINGISVLVFVFEGVVDWRLAAVMAPSAIVGAYAGSRVAQRLDRRVVRGIVIAIGFGVAAYAFYKQWIRE